MHTGNETPYLYLSIEKMLFVRFKSHFLVVAMRRYQVFFVCLHWSIWKAFVKGVFEPHAEPEGESVKYLFMPVLFSKLNLFI